MHPSTVTEGADYLVAEVSSFSGRGGSNIYVEKDALFLSESLFELLIKSQRWA